MLTALPIILLDISIEQLVHVIEHTYMRLFFLHPGQTRIEYFLFAIFLFLFRIKTKGVLAGGSYIVPDFLKRPFLLVLEGDNLLPPNSRFFLHFSPFHTIS